jgi:hypothetical protein
MIAECTADHFQRPASQLSSSPHERVLSATVTLPRDRSRFSDSIPDETHRCVTRIHDLLTSTIGRAILEAPGQSFVRKKIGGYPHSKEG